VQKDTVIIFARRKEPFKNPSKSCVPAAPESEGMATPGGSSCSGYATSILRKAESPWRDITQKVMGRS
jgi:hypothetical protein